MDSQLNVKSCSDVSGVIEEEDEGDKVDTQIDGMDIKTIEEVNLESGEEKLNG